MFFDMDLLCRQRKGKFALIWYASTCGTSKMRKLEIGKVCIARTCDEILQYVMSTSTSPSHRLSLYLAAKLMWGTVLVYQQQVIHLGNDTIYFSQCIQRPKYKFLIEDDDDTDEGTKKRKRTKKAVKPKKPNVIQEDPLVQLQNLEQQMMQTLPDQNITDVIHITLRDEVSTRININEQELFGDEGQLEQQLNQLEGIAWPRIPDPEPLPVPPTTDAQDKRSIICVEDVAQSPSKRRRSEATYVSPVVHVRQTGTISPASPRILMPPPAAVTPPITMMPPPASPRVLRSRIELSANEIRENLQQPSPTRPSRVRPARRHLSLENSIISSRWLEEVPNRTDGFVLGRRSGSIEASPNHRNLDPKEIIALILGDVAYSEDDIISVVRHVNDSLPVDHGLPRLRLMPRRHTQVLDPIPVPEITLPSDPVEANLHLTHALPQVETLPEVPLMPSPRLSRISKDFEPQLERQEPTVLNDPSEIEQPIPRIHTSTPVTLETEAKRLSALLQHIRDLFLRNGNQPLKLEVLCHPLKKHIVARIFNGLLHLHADQYIKMKTFKTNLELKEICPGQRI